MHFILYIYIYIYIYIYNVYIHIYNYNYIFCYKYSQYNITCIHVPQVGTVPFHIPSAPHTLWASPTSWYPSEQAVGC